MSYCSGVVILLWGAQVSTDDSTLSYLPLAHIFDRIVEEFALFSGARIGYFQVRAAPGAAAEALCASLCFSCQSEIQPRSSLRCRRAPPQLPLTSAAALVSEHPLGLKMGRLGFRVVCGLMCAPRGRAG